MSSSPEKIGKSIVGPLIFLGGLFLDVLINVATGGLQDSFWVDLAVKLLGVVIAVAGLVVTFRVMPPLGIFFRTRILDAMGQGKVVNELRADIAMLSAANKRQTKLIKLLNNLESQMIDLLMHPTWSRPKKSRHYKQILRSVAEGAGAIVPREPGDDRRCIILTPVPVRGKKVLKALAWNVDVDSGYAAGIQFDTKEGVAGKVYSEGRPHYAPDVTKDEVFKPHPESPYQYRSLLVCPAKGPDGVTRGVLSLDNTRVDAYAEDDRKRFEWLALRLGVILFIGEQQATEEGRKQ